jgi:hypothetical protein
VRRTHGSSLKAPALSIFVTELTAHHVQGAGSDRRGIADGWYASAADAVCSCPFPTYAACEAHIEQERTDIDAYHQGATNEH